MQYWNSNSQYWKRKLFLIRKRMVTGFPYITKQMILNGNSKVINAFSACSLKIYRSLQINMKSLSAYI